MKRFLVLAVSAAALAGCGLLGGGSQGTAVLPTPAITNIPAPDPEVTAGKFLDLWKVQDYEGMYALLSPLTQDAVPGPDFVQRYKDVWRAAAVSGLDLSIVSSLINPQAAQVRFRVTLHSAVFGDIERETYMDLTRTESGWSIAWSDSAILPELAGGNLLVPQYVTPTRANIYDRNGLALATQADAVALWLDTAQIGDEDAESSMLRILGRLLDERPETIKALYDGYPEGSYYIPLGEVSLEDFQAVESSVASVGGIQWATYTTRYYVDGGLAPQSVGYVSQIQAAEIEDYQARGYEGDEMVGRTGVESVYEDQLRGKPGGTLLVTDPTGVPIGTLAQVDPVLPQAVYTTLDRDLQHQAQNALAGFNGAIVVLERNTGRVLAMVSSPGFDPNAYDTRNPNWSYQLDDLLTNPNHPEINRATGAGYPLGSVFKLITMSAALESGVYTPDTTYTCNGEFTELPGITLYDWTVSHEVPPHGEVTLVQGLERSCNPYFWHIGLDLYNLGLTTALPDMAKAFGLGTSTGIEIGDIAGQVPDPEWKKRTIGVDWAPGDAVQLAIGQASLNVTPLQVARFVAALGNGGTLYRPQLVDRIQNAEGVVSQQFSPQSQGNLPIQPATLQAVQQGMTQVVTSPRGTAYRRFLNFPIAVAGKTGTAESGAENPHAWFAGYTMEGREDKPDIAVVVLAEYQGEGSEWAAPIFRRVLEVYFFGQPFLPYPWESQIGVTRTPTETPGPEELQTETPNP
jgi:penicillin-binding protein 2